MSDDFSALKDMKYSGRGITIGMTPKGNAFVGYSLTGRSSSSQARKLVFGKTTGVIRTDVTDRAQLEKGSPALLLYPAVAYVDGRIVASNGAQTKLLYSTLRNSSAWVSPEDVLNRAMLMPFFEYDEKDDRWIDITCYEPDSPNNTPRISACVNLDRGAFHIVKKGELSGKQAFISPIRFQRGRGNLITTYKGNNDGPLSPFEGSPLEVKVDSNSAGGVAESIYSSIVGGEKPGDNFRVAAAVIMLDSEACEGYQTAIINRSERGS